MKNWKPKRGESVGWIGCPDLKSEIIDIKTYRNGYKRERYYYLKNKLKLTIDEMIKL